MAAKSGKRWSHLRDLATLRRATITAIVWIAASIVYANIPQCGGQPGAAEAAARAVDADAERRAILQSGFEGILDPS